MHALGGLMRCTSLKLGTVDETVTPFMPHRAASGWMWELRQLKYILTSFCERQMVVKVLDCPSQCSLVFISVFAQHQEMVPGV